MEDGNWNEEITEIEWHDVQMKRCFPLMDVCRCLSHDHYQQPTRSRTRSYQLSNAFHRSLQSCIISVTRALFGRQDATGTKPSPFHFILWQGKEDGTESLHNSNGENGEVRYETQSSLPDKPSSVWCWMDAMGPTEVEGKETNVGNGLPCVLC